MNDHVGSIYEVHWCVHSPTNYSKLDLVLDDVSISKATVCRLAMKDSTYVSICSILSFPQKADRQMPGYT